MSSFINNELIFKNNLLIKKTFKNCIANIFQAMQNEANLAIESVGHNPAEYIISFLPFSITRKNKKKIPNKILIAIKERLSK